MFKRLVEGSPQEVTFTFDGQKVVAFEGDNLAAAILAAGLRSTRQAPVSGETRAPFCMMGACFDCIVEIDGETVQACLTAVTDGLEVRPVVHPVTGAGDD